MKIGPTSEYAGSSLTRVKVVRVRGEGGIEENVVAPAGTLSYSFIEFHIFAIFLFISLLVPPLSPMLSTVSSVHTAPVQLRLNPNLPIERRDTVRSIYPPSPELVRLNQFYWPNDHGLYGYELGRILFPYPQCLSRNSSEDDFVYGRHILMYRSWIERFTLLLGIFFFSSSHLAINPNILIW